MKFSSVSVSSALYRGSNISAAAVVLNLLNKLRNRDKCEVAEHLIFFFATSLINSIIQELKC